MLVIILCHARKQFATDVFFCQAYRLEPLIIKAYAGIAPIRIFRHDSKKVPYSSIPPSALSRKATPPKAEKAPATPLEEKTASKANTQTGGPCQW